MAYRFPTLLSEQPSEIHIHSMQPISFFVEVNGEVGRPYPSMIHSYTDGECIVIGVAVRDEVEIPVTTGTRVRLQTTQADGIRTYFTHVVRRHAGPLPALELAWPQGVTRLNRRDSVRIATSIRVDLTYRLPGSAAPNVLRTSTVDLSEGGMTLLVPEPLPDETPLSVRLHLPNTDEIHVCGARVVRSGMGQFPGCEERIWIGVEFGNLSAAIQRSLRHFLWDVQRELLRKGLRS
jgi:c-di-GMP-binding flagellar brake protein YcgR